jgi:thioredoxin-like negative regulator of GroEL
MREVAGGQFLVGDLPSGLVAVCFCADWCGYCQRFLPHFRKVPGSWLVDVTDEEDPLWDSFRIDVVPTVIVFSGGVEVKRWSGVLQERDAQEIAARLAV